MQMHTQTVKMPITSVRKSTVSDSGENIFIRGMRKAIDAEKTVRNLDKEIDSTEAMLRRINYDHYRLSKNEPPTTPLFASLSLDDRKASNSMKALHKVALNEGFAALGRKEAAQIKLERNRMFLPMTEGIMKN